MIPPDELGSFRRDLDQALRLYRREDVLDLGQMAFLNLAGALDDKAEYYQDVLDRGSGSSALRNAIQELTDSMRRISGASKKLARVVRNYHNPKASDRAAGYSDNIDSLQGGKEGIVNSLQALVDKVKEIEGALPRSPGGTGSSGPSSRGRRPYRSTPHLARVARRR